MEVLAFISFFLGASWDFFTEITVPGFEFTFAQLFVGLFLASLGLRVLGGMLGITVPMGDIPVLLNRAKAGHDAGVAREAAAAEARRNRWKI